MGARLRWLTLAAAATATLVLPASALGARVEVFETRTAGGLALRGHVHLPDGPGPFATVLDFSPYWNGPAYGASGQPDSPDTVGMRFLLDAGFAVALVNMRGTGLSQGCTSFGHPTEWQDAGAVVQDLAERPWSNGRVGMFGISFDGWSQWMAVAEAPPALKAVVPMSAVIDLWSLLTRRGAPIHEGPVVPQAWWALTSLSSAPPDPGHARCLSEQGENTGAALDLVRTGDHGPYFDARDVRPHIRDSNVPALVSNGFEYFGEGHVLQYEGLAVLRHTPGDGSCDELITGAADVGRAMLDLRHWASAGASRAFPVNRPTRVNVPGQPSAVRIPSGHRLVLGVSGGAIELEPDPLHPLLSIGGGSLRIPVVEGRLRFR